MSKHKDLSRLVAFDTFVGNVDRGIGNLFYDDTTDTFYGIDLGGAFAKDLCGSTAAKIKKYRHSKSFSLTRKEWKGLRSYYKTLLKLTTRFTPEIICQMMDEYAHYAGFSVEESENGEEIGQKSVRYFGKCKDMVRASYKNASKLLKELKALLQKNGYR